MAAIFAERGDSAAERRSRFAQLPVAAALLDDEGRVVAVNAAWARLAVVAAAIRVGDAFGTNWTALAKDDFVERAVREVAATASPMEAEVTIPGRESSRLLVVLGPAGPQHGVLVVLVNVTAQWDREQKLLFDATHDPLTGVANRARLEQAVTEAVERLRRYGEPFALIYLDLDRFKRFNDEHGHAFGDRVLRAVAERWQQVVRTGDLLARAGGDEFVVVVPHVLGDEVVRLAARLADVVKAPLLVAGRNVSVSVAAGVVVPPREAGAEEALALADQAMYAEKQRRQQQGDPAAD